MIIIHAKETEMSTFIMSFSWAMTFYITDLVFDIKLRNTL